MAKMLCPKCSIAPEDLADKSATDWLDAGEECLSVVIENNQIVESYGSVRNMRIHVARHKDDILPNSRAIYTTEVSTDERPWDKQA